MNAFVNSLGRPASVPLTARTANGMRARSTTSNSALDLFGSIGAMRGKNVIPAFVAAFNDNRDLALRIAQWARDVRGGAGERKIYRDILLWLEANEPRLLVESRLLDNLPELGRFDDLLIFSNPEVKHKAFGLIAQALDAGNGLAAKWLPRKGLEAVELRRAFGLSPKEYRKLIVGLTQVVESDMCAKNWNEINFSHVPSVAMTRYMTAFHRNAPEAFTAYKEALKRGDKGVKVNASAVYPHNVIQKLGSASGWSHEFVINEQNRAVAEAMWEALPNYMNGKNVLPMADVSGSMTTPAGKDTSVTCMDVSTALGLYAATKSTGAFKDMILTFSGGSDLYKLEGATIGDKVRHMHSRGSDWGSNTNFHRAIEQILNHALRNRVPAADMPAVLLVLSDMQFDHCVRYDDSAMQMIRRKYEDAGYEMPQIVFWNLNDAGNKPVKFNDSGVALVSGFSPALMESVLAVEMDKFTPESVMLKAVGKDRYNW